MKKKTKAEIEYEKKFNKLAKQLGGGKAVQNKPKPKKDQPLNKK